MTRRQIVMPYVCALLSAAALPAQIGPAPPGPPPIAPLRGLTPTELATFQEGLRRFVEIDSVSGTEPGAAGSGLGPRYNMNSCAGCHSSPIIGGSSPAINPQVAVATRFGAQNTLPSFIQANGPIRVARFVHAADGSADGTVHSLFVITGRSDAGACAIQQPDFASALSQNNVTFRIPTPVYGAGLIEAIPDSVILANKAANGAAKALLGITGHENVADDGTIARFGWKAQIRSLELFSALAYSAEMGVTNELYPSKREPAAGCSPNALPEDQTHFNANSPVTAMSDVSAFAQFMRWLAPLQPQPSNPSVSRGQQTFNQIGCGLCHTPVLTTGMTTSAALSNRPVQLYSDLLVHRMGNALGDGIQQGNAAGDEYRTAPLWGLGHRIYLLHDGRTTDLTQAISAHSSPGSEANAVVATFQSLAPSANQDLLNFLRSL